MSKTQPSSGDVERRFLVGLTGGIGSGKTAIASGFEAHGIEVVDTDQVARELSAPGGAAIPALREAFGDDLIAEDGGLDRVAMRKRVFADPAQRRRLEAILHPMIRLECDRRLAAAPGAYAILAVPLLVESKGHRDGRFDRILVVDCAPETQVARVMSRSGLSRDEVLAIMAAQSSREERLAAADDVIDNEGPLADSLAAVERLHRQYLRLAGVEPAEAE